MEHGTVEADRRMMVMRCWRFSWGAFLFVWFAQMSVAAESLPRIRWQPDSLVLIQQGGVYGRMERVADGALLSAYSRRQTIYVRRSTDEGRTWRPEIAAVEYPGGAATNAELLPLADGRVLLLYNERPSDGVSPYAIGFCASRDGGRTWTDPRRLYEAGTTREDGCWEPAAIELPSGEIQIYFANESPYRRSSEQEITRICSTDGGATWDEPERVSFRTDHRDGMPVPLLLEGEKQIVVAIEDNGLNGRFKPAVVSLQGAMPVRGDDERRRAALVERLPAYVYAGAPYLVQLPSGETVLSVQSTKGRGVPHDHTNSRMVVYVGDSTAAGFTPRSVPFGALTDEPGLWNSLFTKDDSTVTAISGTTIRGVRGLWAIDGAVLRGN